MLLEAKYLFLEAKHARNVNDVLGKDKQLATLPKLAWKLCHIAVSATCRDTTAAEPAKAPTTTTKTTGAA